VCDNRRGMDRYWIHWPFVYTTRSYILQLTDIQPPLAASWQRLLQKEIFQLPAFRFSCHSCPCSTLANWHSITGSQPGGHFTPTSYSSLHGLTFNWQLKSLAQQSATSRHFIQVNCGQLPAARLVSTLHILEEDPTGNTFSTSPFYFCHGRLPRDRLGIVSSGTCLPTVA
jgi:hypothetical protein